MSVWFGDWHLVNPWAREPLKDADGKAVTPPMLDRAKPAREPKDPATARPLGEAYFRKLPDSQLLGIIESLGWTITQRIAAANVFIHRVEPYGRELTDAELADIKAKFVGA